jgi:hypothetical protein
MRKYEIWHRVTNEFYLGEVFAEDKDMAEEKAIDLLPMSRDDYQEQEEFVVEAIGEQYCDRCKIELNDKEYVETIDNETLCYGCDSKRLIDEQ